MRRFQRYGNSWADAPRRSSLRGVEGCSVIRIGEHPVPAVLGAWLGFAVGALRRQHETLLRTNKCFAEDSGRCQAVTSMRTPNAERRTPNAERRTPNAERRTPNAERRTSGSGAALAMPGRPIDPYAFVSIGGSGNRDQDSPHSNLNRRRVLASRAVVRPDPLALEWATALALRSLPCPRKAAPCARFRSPCWVRRDRRRRVDQPAHAFHAPMETRSRCPGTRLSTCCWPMVVSQGSGRSRCTRVAGKRQRLRVEKTGGACSDSSSGLSRPR